MEIKYCESCRTKLSLEEEEYYNTLCVECFLEGRKGFGGDDDDELGQQELDFNE